VNAHKVDHKFKFPFSVAGIGRNQCPTCARLFTSLTAFEKHRFGAYFDRGCGTDAELLQSKLEAKPRAWSKGLFVWGCAGVHEELGDELVTG
jgi:hypothetical protein